MECAPWGGQDQDRELTGAVGFSKGEQRRTMTRYRTHSIEFKRQVPWSCSPSLRGGTQPLFNALTHLWLNSRVALNFA